jgi:asparagine synthase (glutamine-hydrolysing)
MCGICGVVQIGGEPRAVLAEGVLDAMTDTMTHRGPNDRGTYVEDGVAFGVRRLSIVDVDGGHQPFASEDGRVVGMQNGELYNHVDLRAELAARGHVFRSRCDTEVIPHLYEEDGPGFERRLRGKFGLAVWDGRRRRAVIVRDRLGVKPVYWARAGDLVVFASELKSLLASGLVDPELDADAIDAYLSFGYVPGPATPLAGVSKLRPGHRLVVDPGGVREERYWEHPQPAPQPGLSADEWADGFLEELERCVALRLMSDVPLGAMLSGGIDSSLVVALMARHTSEPVKTFSVGFVEAGEGNELADARFVAEYYGAEHHELELSLADRSVDLEGLMWSMDEPMADLSSLGFLALCELASKHVTVALSGQGADELLGGYKKHRAASLVDALQGFPPSLRRAAVHGPRRFRRAAETLAAGDAATRLVAMSGHVDPALRAELYRGRLAAVDGGAARRSVLACLNGFDGGALETTLYLDAQHALVDDMLHYFDRGSMAHSLEARVPFLDHELVEYCARIPVDLKVRRLTTKWLLKRASRGIVPERIIHKRKLGFFRPAFDDWFRAQVTGTVSEYLLAPDARFAELLDRSAVRRLVARHIDGSDTGNLHLLLSILMLEVWLSSYLPRALRPAEPVRPLVRLSA